MIGTYKLLNCVCTFFNMALKCLQIILPCGKKTNFHWVLFMCQINWTMVTCHLYAILFLQNTNKGAGETVWLANPCKHPIPEFDPRTLCKKAKHGNF